MPRTRLAGEFRKIRTGTKADLRFFVGFEFDLRSNTGPLAEPSGQNTGNTVTTGLSCPAVHVSDSLLTATEKQVHLGLDMRPIQWHLKIYWRVPDSRSLHPHFQWWLKEDNVLTGQPLHPIKHALQIFTDASKEWWGARLNERAARGSWSPQESRQHINYLDLKAIFLILKEFQGLCSNKVLLVAANNTTVVSYINKERDMSGPLCALLWRILTWCTRKQVTIKPDTFQAG